MVRIFSVGSVRCTLLLKHMFHLIRQTQQNINTNTKLAAIFTKTFVVFSKFSKYQSLYFTNYLPHTWHVCTYWIAFSMINPNIEINLNNVDIFEGFAEFLTLSSTVHKPFHPSELAIHYNIQFILPSQQP